MLPVVLVAAILLLLLLLLFWEWHLVLGVAIDVLLVAAAVARPDVVERFMRGG